MDRYSYCCSSSATCLACAKHESPGNGGWAGAAARRHVKSADIPSREKLLSLCPCSVALEYTMVHFSLFLRHVVELETARINRHRFRDNSFPILAVMSLEACESLTSCVHGAPRKSYVICFMFVVACEDCLDSPTHVAFGRPALEP